MVTVGTDEGLLFHICEHIIKTTGVHSLDGDVTIYGTWPLFPWQLVVNSLCMPTQDYQNSRPVYCFYVKQVYLYLKSLECLTGHACTVIQSLLPRYKPACCSVCVSIIVCILVVQISSKQSLCLLYITCTPSHSTPSHPPLHTFTPSHTYTYIHVYPHVHVHVPHIHIRSQLPYSPLTPHPHTLTLTFTQYPDVWKWCPQDIGLWHKSNHRGQEYQDDLCGDGRMDGTWGHTPRALLWEGGCLVLWCVAMGTAYPGEALPCKTVAGAKF